jgi:SAM-dependent methyltransferase
MLSGIDLAHIYNLIRGFPFFWKNYFLIRKQMKKSSLCFPILKLIPCTGDRFEQSGHVPKHYFYQDILVAQKIFLNEPERHVDIGSRIDGFVAHVASFREIEVWDIRPLYTNISTIRFRQFDITQRDFEQVNYSDSLSCLHAMEHFGLGRYGDPVDFEGHIVAWNNMYRMLKKGGYFYFSVPIGKQGIHFDAHRIFSLRYLMELIQGLYSIESFSYIDDNNQLHEDVELSQKLVASNCDCSYGCGIFVMRKL